MYAWSYCDYLLRAHSAKFGAIAQGVKAREPYGELLKRVLGTTLAEFQDGWQQWVKATYSPKKKPR